MSMPFRTSTFGKCILSGEHAVLRGHPAIVFPVLQRQMNFVYIPTEAPLHTEFLGEDHERLHLVFWAVLERTLELLERSRNDVTGIITLTNQIPVGAGMGASAALCVAMARWCIFKEWLTADQEYTFARELEHLFHHRSSGVDIAVAMHGKGLYFCNDQFEFIQPLWQPLLYLSHSDQIGMTSNCIRKVSALWDKDPKQGQHIDLHMAQSARDLRAALESAPEEGLPKLTNAITMAANCFKQWGLTEGKVSEHMDLLIKRGAIAAKPTGSGDGGFILSLWDEAPPETLGFSLIPLQW